MDGASGAGTPELEVRLLGPIEVERDGRPSRSGAEAARAARGARARARPRRLRRPARRGAVAGRAARDGRARGAGLRLAAPQGARPRHRDASAGLRARARARARRRRTASSRLAQEGRAALEGGDPTAAEGALREALALWRGPALADFLYEPFAQTEIARLEELRTVALEERIDADLALGRHAELVSELEALVAAQPLRERPRAQLMLALYRSGRQADALAAYRAARETLVEELGIDPGPELRELEAAILRQDESLLLEETPLARPAMQFRRLVTILFVDVVESMALAEALDPEALGRVLQTLLRDGVGCDHATRRHRGEVRGRRGHGRLRHPRLARGRCAACRARRARHPRRRRGAQRAARQQHGVGLEIRIGIETGEVVATPTDARQRLVTGEAVGIAAKLEGAADGGHDRRRRARGSPDRPRRDARAARAARDQGQARAGPGVSPRRDRSRRARIRAATGCAARRAQARARGAASIAEARGRRLGGARRGGRRARPASGSRASPPS